MNHADNLIGWCIEINANDITLSWINISMGIVQQKSWLETSIYVEVSIIIQSLCIKHGDGQLILDKSVKKVT